MIKRSASTTLAVAVFLTLALVACGGDSVDPTINLFGPNPGDVEFAASLGIDLDDMIETASGLFYRDDLVGEGETAGTGDQLTLAYTGRLVDGNVFDSNTSFTITLGVTSLIEGFTEGVTGMRVGGMRTIVIPADLAYGSQGRQGIPGNAVLVFDLELHSLVRAPG